MNLSVRLVSDIEVNIAKESYHTMENVIILMVSMRPFCGCCSVFGEDFHDPSPAARPGSVFLSKRTWPASS